MKPNLANANQIRKMERISSELNAAVSNMKMDVMNCSLGDILMALDYRKQYLENMQHRIPHLANPRELRFIEVIKNAFYAEARRERSGEPSHQPAADSSSPNDKFMVDSYDQAKESAVPSVTKCNTEGDIHG